MKGRKTGGRKAGTPNAATREIKDLAGQHGETVIAVLAKIVEDETAPPSARIAAGRELLDRGYGKPSEFKQISIEELPPTEELRGEALIAELKKRGLPTDMFDD
ncbi:MAG: hypothetical protein FWD51_07165 [Betaproteobacteria bacterium]|nr:hypothetical protein [Betaproteobacteria bacterium]